MAVDTSRFRRGGSGFSCAGCLTAVSSRFLNRRFLYGVASRFANQRFVFTLGALSIIAAKLLHIYAHNAALSSADLFRWGLSFFSQDTALLLVLRILFDANLFGSARWLRIIAVFIGTIATLIVTTLAVVNLSFFAVAGSEVHWRNVGFAGDKSSRKVLLSGLFSCIVTVSVLFGLTWALQDICYTLFGAALDLFKWPIVFVLSKLPFTRNFIQPDVEYSYIPQQDNDGSRFHESKEAEPALSLAERLLKSKFRTYIYAVIGVLLVLQVVLPIFRPNQSSYIFMSWTLPLLPLVDFTHSSPILAQLEPVFGGSINQKWDARSALGEAPKFDWLPKDKALPGFEDWYEGKSHYRAAQDPLKLSNLDDDLLPELRGKLADVDIRHVMLVKLESTRKDVFPVKKGGQIYEKFANSWDDKKLPEKAEERMATLTETANWITGDFDDGFEHSKKKKRGGINCNNAFTTATYTRKSMTGTLCGITPLVADFNVEYMNHIYQPCLPQIFSALNTLDHGEGNGTDDYTTYPWRNVMMQATTDSYDHQHEQMPHMGYTFDNFVYKESMKDPNSKFGPNTMPDINYYGTAENAVEDYFRDAFVQAKKNNERLFLTHFTSTTHHPFAIPEEEEYVALSEKKELNDLSHYANAIGFVDRWVGRALEILEEEGVANETLVVFVGDHGISIAENHGVTPYYNPNIGNFHVPLVVSHPSLPPINIETPVESLQILPTILDLLRETDSLSASASKAALDLAKNYEGQSLARPLHLTNPKTGRADWQFTVMNPGRAMLGVRNAVQTTWRLIVPVVGDIEWRFTDLERRPHEKEATVAFGFEEFLRLVEERHGIEAAKWAEDGAFMARWWVEDNKNRYRYIPA